MSLNQKFLAQVRAVTRSLFRRGPASARTVMEEAVKNASAIQAAAVKSAESLTPPPASNQSSYNAVSDQSSYDAVSGQSSYDAVSGQSSSNAVSDQPRANAVSGQSTYDVVSDMLADLSRLNLESNPFIARLPSTGTAAKDLPGHFIDASYTTEAGTRNYKLYVPGSYAGQTVPLVVMLHGCTQNPDDFAIGTGMNQLAEEYGCLVAYPAQSLQANASRCWNWFSAADQQRDQGEPSIIAGLTRDIMARYAIDPSRVYVAGLSAGGAMAAIMGTLYPDLYAAVGVHSGLPFAVAHDLPSALAAMKGDFRTHHKPGKSLPIIVFHGDRDTTVHPANGDELIKRRRRHPAEDIVVEPGAVPDGHAYTRTVHRKPDGSIHAEHWVIHGSGHAWSGGDTRGTYTDGRGPNASREMMRFFRTAR